MNASMKSLVFKYRFQLGITALLLCLMGLFIMGSPRTFLQPRIYLAFMSAIPFPALLGLGLTLLIISGEMDLSFPSVMMISGLSFSFVTQATGSPALGFFSALATGAFAGFCNGIIVVRIGVPAIIATIGTQFFWRGAGTVLADGLAINLTQLRGTPFHFLMAGRLGDWLPMQTVWCLGLAVFFWFLLNRHTFGDDILFIGDDIRTARMMGVRTGRVRMGLFVIMGLISALVSVMICLEMANWWPTQGEGYLLLVFAAIFLGGTSVFGGRGTIYGTVIGSIIIGILEAGIIGAGLSGYWTRLVHGLVIVVSVSVYARMFQQKRE
jgi:simple sugar transport system permease protein